MSESFKRALADATKQLEALAAERAEIDGKIQRLKQLIRHLAAAGDERAGGAGLEEGSGLTSGIRAALRRSRDWRPAAEVRQTLISLGYDLSGYANASAVVYTILNRLVKQGLVEKDAEHGAARYRWRSHAEAEVAAALQKLHRRRGRGDGNR